MGPIFEASANLFKFKHGLQTVLDCESYEQIKRYDMKAIVAAFIVKVSA